MSDLGISSHLLIPRSDVASRRHGRCRFCSKVSQNRLSVTCHWESMKIGVLGLPENVHRKHGFFSGKQV